MYGGGAAGGQRMRGANRGRGGNAGDRQNELYGAGALEGRGGVAVEVSPMEEIVDDYEEIQLSPLDDFSREDEIVFWAHDDTVEPGKVYRYRIRLGVLNPVAGTNQLSAKDSSMKNKAVLWSDFSDITEQ
jgi:hypothetical protein